MQKKSVKKRPRPGVNRRGTIRSKRGLWVYNMGNVEGLSPYEIARRTYYNHYREAFPSMREVAVRKLAILWASARFNPRERALLKLPILAREAWRLKTQGERNRVFAEMGSLSRQALNYPGQEMRRKRPFGDKKMRKKRPR